MEIILLTDEFVSSAARRLIVFASHFQLAKQCTWKALFICVIFTVNQYPYKTHLNLFNSTTFTIVVQNIMYNPYLAECPMESHLKSPLQATFLSSSYSVRFLSFCFSHLLFNASHQMEFKSYCLHDWQILSTCMFE